jgi:hypothetical protein
MNGICDENGNPLSPEEIKLMSKTPLGRKKLQNYLLMARTAMSVQEILSYLGEELRVFSRPLSPEEMQNVCNILWHVFFVSTSEELSNYIKSVVDSHDDIDFNEERIGHA